MKSAPLILLCAIASFTAACDTDGDDVVGLALGGEIAFERSFLDPGAPSGQRTYSLTRMFKLETGSRGLFYCHIGTFSANASTSEIAVVDLTSQEAVSVAPPVASDRQFFEANGTFGVRCARVSLNQRPELEACVAAGQQNCQVVREAENALPDLDDFTPIPFCTATADGSPVDCLVTE